MVKFEKKLGDYYILVSSMFLCILAIDSIYINIIANNHIYDTINVILNFIALPMFFVAYYFYFVLKDRVKYKYIICFTLTIYLFIMILMCGTYDPVPGIALVVAITYFFLTDQTIIIKILYSFIIFIIQFIIELLIELKVIKIYIEPGVYNSNLKYYVITTSIYHKVLLLTLIIGGYFVIMQIIKFLIENKKFSRKEQLVIDYIKNNPACTNNDIRIALKVSESTVKFHITNIYDKIGLEKKERNRNSLLKYLGIDPVVD